MALVVVVSKACLPVLVGLKIGVLINANFSMEKYVYFD